eukprot:TRINITY_DN65757_c0_g1_i1.p1 TRINITY_DN65757_c0_g1~~TRINITY_DN65757_c0_g1_i1.p1  ORF type:complete len:647 (+),score=150.84 TRINITY_DN65757_c0_g1_i1:108-2048(+)
MRGRNATTAALKSMQWKWLVKKMLAHTTGLDLQRAVERGVELRIGMDYIADGCTDGADVDNLDTAAVFQRFQPSGAGQPPVQRDKEPRRSPVAADGAKSGDEAARLRSKVHDLTQKVVFYRARCTGLSDRCKQLQSELKATTQLNSHLEAAELQALRQKVISLERQLQFAMYRTPRTFDVCVPQAAQPPSQGGCQLQRPEVRVKAPPEPAVPTPCQAAAVQPFQVAISREVSIASAQPFSARSAINTTNGSHVKCEPSGNSDRLACNRPASQDETLENLEKDGPAAALAAGVLSRLADIAAIASGSAPSTAAGSPVALGNGKQPLQLPARPGYTGGSTSPPRTPREEGGAGPSGSATPSVSGIMDRMKERMTELINLQVPDEEQADFQNSARSGRSGPQRWSEETPRKRSLESSTQGNPDAVLASLDNASCQLVSKLQAAEGAIESLQNQLRDRDALVERLLSRLLQAERQAAVTSSRQSTTPAASPPMTPVVTSRRPTRLSLPPRTDPLVLVTKGLMPPPPAAVLRSASVASACSPRQTTRSLSPPATPASPGREMRAVRYGNGFMVKRCDYSPTSRDGLPVLRSHWQWYGNYLPFSAGGDGLPTSELTTPAPDSRAMPASPPTDRRHLQHLSSVARSHSYQHLP